MEIRHWKSKIKQQCIEAGVYEPCCDRMLENLADLMLTFKDYSDMYEDAKAKGDFEKMTACAIRKSDLHRACMTYWRELMLTPKEYQEFLKNSGESKKENKLLALIREDNNVQSE